MNNQVLGKLVGNTGDPANLTMVMNSSFGGRRGEFVRIPHQERPEESPVDILGRIVSIHRSNVLYNSGMGSGVNDLELMPGAQITGESLFGKVEVVGPAPAPIERLHNRWRWHLFLRGGAVAWVSHELQLFLETATEAQGGRDLRFIVDRDPVALL